MFNSKKKVKVQQNLFISIIIIILIMSFITSCSLFVINLTRYITFCNSAASKLNSSSYCTIIYLNSYKYFYKSNYYYLNIRLKIKD